MQWGTLALLALLPLLQGDSTTTQVSPTQNDILMQDEISKENSSNLDLNSNPEFVEELSEETNEGDSTVKASMENTGKLIKKPDGELQWKSKEDAIWDHSFDYIWDYNEDFNEESSGQLSEEYKEAIDDSSFGMTAVNTTLRPTMKMLSVVTKEPTAVP